MAWEENPRICLHMQLIAILSRTGVFNNTTLANAKGSPLVSTTLPVIFCAINCVMAERHSAVVNITFSFILLLFCLLQLFLCSKSII